MESLARAFCASQALSDAVLELVLQVVEGDSLPTLRAKFRTGSLAVLDRAQLERILLRAPMRYASYSGVRLLQRSPTVGCMDVSGNADAASLVSVASNPSYFPGVVSLLARGVALSGEQTAKLLSSLPRTLTELDLSHARMTGTSTAIPATFPSTLRHLRLADSRIPVPVTPSVALRTLDLSHHRGLHLPPLLRGCSALTDLRLGYATIAATRPDDQRSARDRSNEDRDATDRTSAAASLAHGVTGAIAARGSLSDAEVLLIATAPCAVHLSTLDLRGAALSTEAVSSLGIAAARSLRTLDLDNVVVTDMPATPPAATLAAVRSFLRALWPCEHLRALRLPPHLTAGCTMERLLRWIQPLVRLRWLSATVGSLHTGTLSKERAEAAAEGSADAVDPADLAPADSLGPWCSLRRLDVAIAAWVTSPDSSSTAGSGGLDTTALSTVRLLAQASAVSTSASGSAVSGSVHPLSVAEAALDAVHVERASVQDLGPLLAALPQLRQLRVRGGGHAAARGARLVMARRLTQYARVCSRAWDSRASRLRRSTDPRALRSALARCPLEQVSFEGVPDIHPRVWLILACLPYLVSLRAEPVMGGGHALSAAGGIESVRHHAAGGPSTQAASVSGTSSSSSRTGGSNSGTVASAEFVPGAARVLDSGTVASSEAITRALRGRGDGGVNATVLRDLAALLDGETRSARLFRPPRHSELPGAHGIDRAAEAQLEASAAAVWLLHGSASTPAAVSATRNTPRGPEEEGDDDDGHDDHQDARRSGEGGPVRGGGMLTSAGAGALWEESEHSSDEDEDDKEEEVDVNLADRAMVGAGGDDDDAVMAPLVAGLRATSEQLVEEATLRHRKPASDIHQAHDNDDDDADDDLDFGAFAKRPVAAAAPKVRSRPKPPTPVVPTSGLAHEALLPPEMAARPAVGFASLRQLSLPGCTWLDDRLALRSLARLVRPALRRVDLRGTSVSSAGAAALLLVMRASESAAFGRWLEAVSGAVVDEAVPPPARGPWLNRPVTSASEAEWAAERHIRSTDDVWPDEEVSAPVVAPVSNDEADAESDHDAAGTLRVSSQPFPCATALVVASGERFRHVTGGHVSDALEGRGVMVPCQLNGMLACASDRAAEADARSISIPPEPVLPADPPARSSATTAAAAAGGDTAADRWRGFPAPTGERRARGIDAPSWR